MKIKRNRPGITPLPCGRATPPIRLTASLLFTVTVLAACQTQTTRPCPVFDHPAATEWFDHEVGDAINLSGENGASTYTVVSVENTGPVGTGAYNTPEEELYCQVYKKFTLTTDDAPGALVIELAQNEVLNVPSDQEQLLILVSMKFENRPRISIATLFATPLELNGAGNFDESRYQPEANYGTRQFQDVISSTAREWGLADYEAGEVPILFVAFARDVGLIALERTDVGLLVGGDP